MHPKCCRAKSDHGAEIILWDTGPSGLTAQGHLGTVSGCWKLEGIFLFLRVPPGTSSAILSETRAGARLSKAGPGSSSDLVLLVLGKIIPVPKQQAVSQR